MAGIASKLVALIGDESVNGWARRHGLAPQTVHGWIKDDRMPYSAALKQLADTTGKSVNWWKGLEETYKTEPVKAFTSGDGVSSAVVANASSVNDDKVLVKRYVDVRGSAGPGYNNDTDGLIELVEFNAAQLRNIINVPAQHLVIGGVDGYSMEPFLFHGDQVFIDTRHQTFQNDGVYALLHNGELRYKRVRINYADKTVLLKSDNDGGLGPEVLNEQQANGLKIIGKVIPFKFGHFKL